MTKQHRVGRRAESCHERGATPGVDSRGRFWKHLVGKIRRMWSPGKHGGSGESRRPRFPRFPPMAMEPQARGLVRQRGWPHGRLNVQPGSAPSQSTVTPCPTIGHPHCCQPCSSGTGPAGVQLPRAQSPVRPQPQSLMLAPVALGSLWLCLPQPQQGPQSISAPPPNSKGHHRPSLCRALTAWMGAALPMMRSLVTAVTKWLCEFPPMIQRQERVRRVGEGRLWFWKGQGAV